MCLSATPFFILHMPLGAAGVAASKTQASNDQRRCSGLLCTCFLFGIGHAACNRQCPCLNFVRRLRLLMRQLLLLELRADLCATACSCVMQFAAPIELGSIMLRHRWDLVLKVCHLGGDTARVCSGLYAFRMLAASTRDRLSRFLSHLKPGGTRLPAHQSLA